MAPNGLKASFAPSNHLWAALLAGGDGVRLQHLTRRIAGDSRPKQFCRVVGDETLFRQTRKRLEPLFRGDRQISVVSRSHQTYYRDDLTGTSESCIIEQPLNRGTGVAIALAAIHVLLRDPDAIVGFFPCDHYYDDDGSFRSTLASTIAWARRDPEAIVLVGAKADYPEVEYGWIEPGLAIWGVGTGPVYRVQGFWEKPPEHQACELMRRGFLWNTFVAIGRATAFVDLLSSEVPEVVLEVTAALADGSIEAAYQRLPTVDFSRDVLAHQTDKLLVVRDDTSGWADLGSPDRVLATLSRHRIQPEWFTYDQIQI